MPGSITYDLRPSQDSNDFYRELSAFTNDAWVIAFFHLSPHVADYYRFIEENNIEPLRSKDEYLLELVITGVLVKNYYSKARRTGSFSTGLLARLYELRKQHQKIKPLVDRFRGILSYALLEKKSGTVMNWSLKGFDRLLHWLSATGEFNEEVIRLTQWKAHYKTKTRTEFRSIIKSCIYVADCMEAKGEEILGKYVCKVPQFLQTKVHDYRYKEDYFFVSRSRNEYFMNMFGAEILNRQLREEFKQMPHKAVLLPSCMRTEPEKGCGARHDGKELVCMQCSRTCNVGIVATQMRKHKVKTYLIPHSSGFSKFLSKWENNKETGLVGVTCILNLLTGGYEMKRLNISSQCIFLDYCACKKHWDKKGFPTSLNINELVNIVASN